MKQRRVYPLVTENQVNDFCLSDFSEFETINIRTNYIVLFCFVLVVV